MRKATDNYLKNGYIYEGVKWLFLKLRFLNLVELFKYVACRLNPNPRDAARQRASSWKGADIFIVSKWVALAIFSIWQIRCDLLTILVWYLIATNIFTYFYYHIGTDESLIEESVTPDRIRRRFVNLMAAIAFSIFAFAYLNEVPYRTEIDWGKFHPRFLYGLLYSFSTAFSGNFFGDIKPKTATGFATASIELAITFVFVAVILSRSFPPANRKEDL